MTVQQLASDVETTAAAFAASVTAFTAAIEEKRTAAYQQAGKAGVADVEAHASSKRVEAQIAGLLIGLGLKRILRRNNVAVTPVTDFAARWAALEDGEHLETKRPSNQ
jgi:hypothetical protein